MKKIIFAFLSALAVVVATYAGPIIGLVDRATGKGIPDADLRYMKVGDAVGWDDIANKPTVWTNIASQSYAIITNSPWLKSDGSVAYTGTQDAGGYGITNLGVVLSYDLRLSRSGSDAIGDSAITENFMFDTVGYFAGSLLYSYTNPHPAVMAFRLEENPIATHIYDGFPLVPGTNTVLYVSDPVYSFMPKGLYQGKFYAHIVELDGTTPYSGSMPVVFGLVAIPTNTITSYTNYTAIPIGVSPPKYIDGTMRRVNLSGNTAADVNASDFGSDFYFGGAMSVVNPTTNTYLILFNTGGDYEATVTVPIPTGDLPTKDWVEARDAPKTGSAYARTYDTDTESYGWVDTALGIDYAAANNVIASNTASQAFEIDAASSGFYLSMATMYMNCTNIPNIEYSDAVVSLYIHPSRSGAYAQYRGTMSFTQATLTNATAGATNRIYIADSSGFLAQDMLVLDADNVYNTREFNRISGVGDGYLDLENNTSTNTHVLGTLISKANQFGQLMYYDVTQQDKVWGDIAFTNTVFTKFNINIVMIQ